MAKSFIDQIAESIEDMDGPVVPQGERRFPDEEEDEAVYDGADDDLSPLIPKSHVPDMPELAGNPEAAAVVNGETTTGDIGSISDSMDGGSEMTGDVGGEMGGEGATEETPIVTPGETNAAPPSPESFQPAGVLKLDASLFIKLLEQAKAGGDVHQMASQASRLCGDPSCTALTMDHFDQFAGATPPVEVAVDSGIPSVEAPIDGEAPIDEVPPTEEEAAAEEGGEGGPPPEITGESGGEETGSEETSEEGEDKDDDGEDDSTQSIADEMDDDDDEEDEDEEGPPFEESIKPINDPVLEEFATMHPAPSSSEPKKDDKEDGPPVKKKSKKPWEKDDGEDDDSIAESVDRLTRLMTTKANLIFKDTQSGHVVEFQAKANPTFQRVFAESVTKALGNKKWLSENGLKPLAKFNKAAIINTADMGQRHLMTLK